VEENRCTATDTQTHRRTDTQTHRHTDTQTERRTDTQTHKHTEIQTHRWRTKRTAAQPRHRRTDTQTHREKEPLHGHTLAQTHRHTVTQRHRDIGNLCTATHIEGTPRHTEYMETETHRKSHTFTRRTAARPRTLMGSFCLCVCTSVCLCVCVSRNRTREPCLCVYMFVCLCVKEQGKRTAARPRTRKGSLFPLAVHNCERKREKEKVS